MDDEQQVPRDRDEEFTSRPYEDELDTDDEDMREAMEDNDENMGDRTVY